MTKYLFFICFAFIFNYSLFAQAESYATVNVRWEHEFTGPTNIDNPYKDVDLRVTYTYMGNENIEFTSTGFWDGGSKYKIRASFPKSGLWVWKTSCNKSELDNIEESVMVGDYNGSNALYKHGYLKISNMKMENGKEIILFDDNEKFFWLGGTAWSAPVKMTFNEWKQYIDNRADKGFTVIQVAPSKWKGNVFNEEDWNIDSTYNVNNEPSFISKDLINPPYWQLFDKFVKYANDKGIVIVLIGLSEPVNDLWDSNELGYFVKYIVGRLFGSFVIFSPSFDDYKNNQKALDIEIADSIRKYTSRHLVSQHPGTGASDADFNEHADDFYETSDFSMNQSGHHDGDLEKVYKAARKWNRSLFNKSGENGDKYVVNTEAFYTSGDEVDAFFYDRYKGTDHDARALGWISWLSGSLGYTFGAMRIWNYHIVFNDEFPDNSNVSLSSLLDDNKFKSVNHMKYLKNFLYNSNIEWWNLVPLSVYEVKNPHPDSIPENKIIVLAKSKSIVVVYSPEINSFELDLQSIFNENNDAIVYATWYNPRTGKYIGAKSIDREVTISNNNTHLYSYPDSVPDGDMVLKLSIDQIQQPNNVTISVYNSHPKVSWTKNPEPEVQAYEIWKKKDSGNWLKVQDNVSQLFFVDNSEVEWNTQSPPSYVYYKIKAKNVSGSVSQFSQTVSMYVQNSNFNKKNSNLSNSNNKLPTKYDIYPAYPNPFNPTTNLIYAIPKKSIVNLAVYNLQGQLVEKLIENEIKAAGFYEIVVKGESFSSGIYIVVFKANSFVKSQKIALIK